MKILYYSSFFPRSTKYENTVMFAKGDGLTKAYKYAGSKDFNSIHQKLLCFSFFSRRGATEPSPNLNLFNHLNNTIRLRE